MKRGPSFKPDASGSNPVQVWYDNIQKGKLTGNAPLCQWLGPDMWLFHRDPLYPFKFIRANGQEIEPLHSFETDGGSIPDYVRGLPNMSRWHFGAAYLIHDWIWHLNKLHQPTYTFEESNIILIEAVKTLIEDGYLHNNFTGDVGTVRNIWRGVQSSFARNKWDKHNA